MGRTLIISALSLFLASTAFAQDETEEVDMNINVGGLDISTSVKTTTRKSRKSTGSAAEVKASAMSRAKFKRLLKDIKKATFEDDQLEVVALSAKRNHFNCKQVGALVDAITFEDGKVKVVELTKKKIVDPEDSHTILSHFTFSDGRNKAKRILAQ